MIQKLIKEFPVSTVTKLESNSRTFYTKKEVDLLISAAIDKAVAEEEAMTLLKKVGIADKAKEYPSHLSGGQQQRAAIARALAISPEILLFDEPTSSLDPELVDEVLSVIRNLAEQGKTMLVVTHEMAFARKVSNKVIFLHDGLVEEEGHPDTVFTNPQSERCRNFLFNRRE